MTLCERCGNYPNICGCAEADALAAQLADVRERGVWEVTSYAALMNEHVALQGRCTYLAARLAEAVVVMKQVDGCRDGLCDVCQDKLDGFLDAARATDSAPAVRCEHEWRPYAFDLVSGAPSSYYCPRCGVNRATTTVTASGAELTDEEKEGLQGIREGMNR